MRWLFLLGRFAVIVFAQCFDAAQQCRAKRLQFVYFFLLPINLIVQRLHQVFVLRDFDFNIG